jgi:hypothetical protein
MVYVIKQNCAYLYYFADVNESDDVIIRKLHVAHVLPVDPDNSDPDTQGNIPGYNIPICAAIHHQVPSLPVECEQSNLSRD